MKKMKHIDGKTQSTTTLVSAVATIFIQHAYSAYDSWIYNISNKSTDYISDYRPGVIQADKDVPLSSLFICNTSQQYLNIPKIIYYAYFKSP
jgi:hypothetical protein